MHRAPEIVSFTPVAMLRTRRFFAVLAVALLLAAGCAPAAEPPAAAEMPALETRADSLAMRVYEAHGGPAAWASLPYLRFNFGSEREGVARPPVKHLWDRRSGAYRIEMPGGVDTTYVVLFNVNTRQGTAYLNGAPLDTSQSARMMEQAYGRFINDTYWLLVPLKLFDPGVRRAYVPDSSDAATDVLHLAFDDVGMTPGDQYWLFVDAATGRLRQWAYRLQSGREGRFAWTGYEEHAAPGGPLHLATRKEAVGAAVAILTDHLDTPAAVAADLFTDPKPRL